MLVTITILSSSVSFWTGTSCCNVAGNIIISSSTAGYSKSPYKYEFDKFDLSAISYCSLIISLPNKPVGLLFTNRKELCIYGL